MKDIFDHLDSIDDLILLGESSELECKLAQGKDGLGEVPFDMWETYSAFANTDGGYIVLGMQEKKDKYIPKGITRVAQVKKQIFDLVNNPQKVNINLLTNSFVKELPLGDEKSLLVVYVPRAKRTERPVYLNGNPLGNSYQRCNESDQRLSEEQVKRMLAEQSQDSRDSIVLEHFQLADLDMESVRNYRQRYANLDPSHPWNELSDLVFLEKIKAYKTERETGRKGLTAAGLLMFGTHTAIQDQFPFYMLDYQEHSSNPDERWIDRVTLDGKWSGNLYDFSQRVYRKLVENIKVPFRIENGLRQEDTPVHIALREALANTIIHADYSDKASIQIIKKPNSFYFRNPGLMRIPIEIALKGGDADCRNRLLAQMFRYIRFGDQAGSGLPRILSGWKTQHWRMPLLREVREPNEQTVLELKTVSLYPQEIFDTLTKQYGKKFLELSELERTIVIEIYTNEALTHKEICLHISGHSRDVTLALVKLEKLKMISASGKQKNKIYHRPEIEMPTPDNQVGKILAKSFIKNPELASENPELASENPELGPENPELDLDTETSQQWQQLKLIASKLQGDVRNIGKEKFVDGILQLCQSGYISLSDLALLLNKKADTLRKSYLNQLVKENKLELAYPTAKNHPKQAYKTVGQL
ncbi:MULTISPECIES: RNA-binding domain-containing protein [Rodentibacter]|uniref:RNA-binding domain-containing protein n=1 Tax=Rodentibacter TaxID=1960084 RepID=UPI001CFD7334|nr:RNA-binding domain-containing protein [Rodentibacter sp. JRC1]GJI56078.1 hypothetical protein HEMROJRC1_11900 [Rodentibacter sp. JRC1]